MAKDSSPNQWLWLIARRCGVHSISGAIIGAFGGAACLGLAFGLIGIVLGATNPSFFVTTANASGEEVTDNIAIGGLLLGLTFGAIAGAIIGLLGFAIIGIVATPALRQWPDKRLRHSMLNLMTLATVLGVLLYFVWSAIIGMFREGFAQALQDGVIFAFFGILAMMGLGQIAGIWRAASKLKQAETI